MKFYHSSFVSNLTILSLFLNINGAFSRTWQCPSGDILYEEDVYSHTNMNSFEHFPFKTIEDEVYENTSLSRGVVYKVLDVHPSSSSATTFAVFTSNKRVAVVYQQGYRNNRKFIEECT
ncbi:CSEP0008 putative effector protein [Blumeria hordei DH14]|uniref:CSEP0008 putative effector protein n=1 Tax=Blumeria graminis f. sp. hordei (strain DH14) TaxID=546991 RepID=N1JGD1_BLUG1|nr:CSEP0008 putative effector protein [Blumeria hordei DH14]